MKPTLTVDKSGLRLDIYQAAENLLMLDPAFQKTQQTHFQELTSISSCEPFASSDASSCCSLASMSASTFARSLQDRMCLNIRPNNKMKFVGT
jgi:hypothetical protein